MTSSLCQRWSGLLTFSGAWESQSVFLLLLGTAVAVEHLLHDVVWSCYLKVFDYLRFYGTMFLCVAAMNQISPISCSVQSIADPIRGLLRDSPPLSSILAPWSRHKSFGTECKMASQTDFQFPRGSRSEEISNKGIVTYPIVCVERITECKHKCFKVK